MLGDVLKYALLGLGPGGVYALLALGIVLVYRGSGVVNFAAGGFALFGAAFFLELRDSMPTFVAIALATLATAVLGAAVQLLLMRPMRHASPLARVVATLGVFVALLEAAEIRYGLNSVLVPSFLPDKPWRITDTIVVGADRLWILGITTVLTFVLWAVYRYTLFGIATTGVAENERATATLGWSPNLIATLNWAAGGALGGFAGILLSPLFGFAPGVLTLTVVPALAAALVGSFRSFPLTLAGGLLLGVLESEATYLKAEHPKTFLGFIPTQGLSSSVPFLVIIVILVVRGKALPLRGHLTDRLPALGRGVPKRGTIAVVVGVFIASLWVFTTSWVAALTTSAIIAIIALSAVVVTGYAGQLSLAQFALAGFGALVSSRLADAWNVPFFAALVVAIAVTVPLGLLVALPAVRARGVNLAVATLGLAIVIESVILSNPDYNGGPIEGTRVPDPHLFSWNLNSVKHPERYALLVLALLLLSALMVANLRRGRAGRRLIAVRDNERAAASLGVNVATAKLYAFAVGAMLAATGGVLLAFRNSAVSFDGFGVFRSIELILLAVIGGIGFVTGALIAGSNAVAGIGQQLISHLFDIEGWFLLCSAILLLLVVVLHPDGIAEQMTAVFRRLTGRRRAAKARPTTAVDVFEREALRTVDPQVLEIRDLGVRFGGVVAVDGVNITVAPGQVVGLIGPNGAGKTTIIDSCTGFLRHYSGHVLLDGRPIDNLRASDRARRGLTRSFQSLELFEDLTVGDNLRIASDDRSFLHYLRDLLRPGRQPLRGAALAAIHEFELTQILDSYPAQLSYAQRRAVGVARAVATSPSVLLLDEPAAGLDDMSTRELARLIRRLADEWKMGILLIEHDVSMVLSTCDEVVAINFGVEIATGTPDHIRTHPAVVEAYLGSTVDSPEPAPIEAGIGGRP